MRRIVVPLVGLLLLTGCGGGDDRAGTAPVPAITPGQDQPDARAVYDAAVKPVQREPATSFQADLSAGTYPLYSVRGLYSAIGTGQDEEGRWSATVHLYEQQRSSEPPRIMESRSVHNKVWMRMLDWTEAARACWLAIEPASRPLGFLALQQTEPAYFSLLGQVTVLGFADDTRERIRADVDLRYALLLQTTQMAKTFGVTPKHRLTGHRVPVEIVLDEGRVTGLRMTGAGLRTGLEAAAVDMTDDVVRVLRQLELAVTYTAAPQERDPITAPAAIFGSSQICPAPPNPV